MLRESGLALLRLHHELSHGPRRGAFKIPSGFGELKPTPQRISSFAVRFRHARRRIYVRVSSRIADATSTASFYHLTRNNAERFRTCTKLFRSLVARQTCRERYIFTMRIVNDGMPSDACFIQIRY